MTNKYSPYEKAIAERINGILKQEFDIAKKALFKNAIDVYNRKQPHRSNHMLRLLQMYKHNNIKR